jgi:acyl dehydratase
MRASQSGLSFDDFEVGQRFVAGPRVVTQHDLDQFTALSGDAHPMHWDLEYCRGTRFGRPILHGPFGIAIASGLMHELGIFGDFVIAMRSIVWEFLAPMFVGDAVSLDMTITRRRVSSQGDRGTVNRWLTLVNQDAVAVQSGMSSVVLHRRPDDVDRAPMHALDFASLGWARALAERLNADDAFRTSTADFDGSIGLRAGDESSYLRIFRGQVLDCTRQSDAPRRFSILGSEPAWVDFAFAPRNDFIARATRGQFKVRGDVYEYLRLTKGIHLIWDHIRGMASEARQRDGG